MSVFVLQLETLQREVLPMAEYTWPGPKDRNIIGTRVNRLDGPAKTTGTAKYAYDVNLPNMLHAKILRCPHAHAKIAKINVSKAEAMEGVKAVRILNDVGTEIKWSLDEVVAVAAVTEEIAKDAIRAIEVDYELLPHSVNEKHLSVASNSQPAEEETTGDPDTAMSSAKVRSTGSYGLTQIAHCCLEPHGQVSEWSDSENVNVWASTQAVSRIPAEIGDKAGIPASNVHVDTQYMGGGFGSKFSADRWGVECVELSRDTGQPVKLMLERDAEVAVAGARPSAYGEVEVGCDVDGNVIAWSSKSWGSGGPSGTNSPPIPYVFAFENQRHQHTSVATNTGPARAWRAPRHPQGCLITMSALNDAAGELGMDPLEFFFKNISRTGARANLYKEELKKAAEMISWKEKWHKRGEGRGPLRQGLGLALHTWGGRAHGSNAAVVVYPDGLVEVKLGSQDLGTGTRTIIAMTLAETFGIRIEQVKVNIGNSDFPQSGPSGGSTTVGGVTGSTRRAGINALNMLFEKIAPELGVAVDDLEAVNQVVRSKSNSLKSLPWTQATAMLGVIPLTATGSNPGPGKLNDSGVGGVQMADVSVDIETGVVKVNKMVAVQDCGLIINMKTAESQVLGALIMGITYALTEERVFDDTTGRMLNANMEFYKLAGIGDIGQLEVHMMTGPEHDERGVIGLGEPPVISPGAAIATAVANATGVSMPELPLTPDRVLAALKKGGVS